MTKVEHTKTQKVNVSYRDNFTKELFAIEKENKLVTDATLVLVEYMTAALPNCIIDNTNICIDGKCYKPLLISETEKIEVGDWYYCKEEGVVLQADYEPKGEGIYKVLALPEHFSPQQLQMIVDGKLKEGKYFVECEDKEYGHVDDYSKPHGFQKQIKLNPHITIYPVEEKLVPITLLEKCWNALQESLAYENGATARLMASTSNVPRTFQEWYQQNVK